MEEAAVEMSDVVKEMCHQVPERFPRFEVFLAANVTKPAMDNSSAIKTIFFFPFRQMGHNNFFLKVSTKNTSFPGFSLLNN